ncbi:lipase/esterase [Thraustotheca clavata]|uniref:Lipase/esterase n=1 Tax=Thraustotheca clavata TaxID=74557 RepID=A0A1V9YV97_9STRA|nr:lipase/esterase [Thraustotheca clavata]
MITTVITLLSLVGYVIISPFLVLCDDRDDAQTFYEAVFSRVMRRITSSDPEFLRGLYGFYGNLQSLIYRPSKIVETPTVKGVWYEAIVENAIAEVTVYYVHGGGFVCGSATTQSWDLIKPLTDAFNAKKISTRVFSLEYDLTPQHQYPHQRNQTLEGYKWLLAQKAQNMILMGDSAGGNMVTVLLQTLVRENLPMPLGAILISPWVDISVTARSYTYNNKTDVFDGSTITSWRDLYATDKDYQEASPLFHSLEGLPPLMVVYGGKELMTDDVTEFVSRAKKAKVDVKVICHPRMVHNYPVFFRYSGAAAEAYYEMGKFAWSLISNC